jgi:hypothetical protein
MARGTPVAGVPPAPSPLPSSALALPRAARTALRPRRAYAQPQCIDQRPGRLRRRARPRPIQAGYVIGAAVTSPHPPSGFWISSSHAAARTEPADSSATDPARDEGRQGRRRSGRRGFGSPSARPLSPALLLTDRLGDYEIPRTASGRYHAFLAAEHLRARAPTRRRLGSSMTLSEVAAGVCARHSSRALSASTAPQPPFLLCLPTVHATPRADGLPRRGPGSGVAPPCASACHDLARDRRCRDSCRFSTSNAPPPGARFACQPPSRPRSASSPQGVQSAALRRAGSSPGTPASPRGRYTSRARIVPNRRLARLEASDVARFVAEHSSIPSMPLRTGGIVDRMSPRNRARHERVDPGAAGMPPQGRSASWRASTHSAPPVPRRSAEAYDGPALRIRLALRGVQPRGGEGKKEWGGGGDGGGGGGEKKEREGRGEREGPASLGWSGRRLPARPVQENSSRFERERTDRRFRLTDRQGCANV